MNWCCNFLHIGQTRVQLCYIQIHYTAKIIRSSAFTHTWTWVTSVEVCSDWPCGKLATSAHCAPQRPPGILRAPPLSGRVAVIPTRFHSVTAPLTVDWRILIVKKFHTPLLYGHGSDWNTWMNLDRWANWQCHVFGLADLSITLQWNLKKSLFAHDVT